MAKKKTEQEQAEPEKTIGKGEAPAASNGAPPEEVASEAATDEVGTDEGAPEAVEDKTDEIAATYERAKKELNDAVGKLRDEIKQIDVEKARQQAQTWVEENPTLTVFLALGAGIVVGKLISEALKPAPPPTLSERLRSQRRALTSQARGYAHDVSDVVADRAAEVGEAIVRRARELGEDVSRRARELGEDVTRRATDAVSATSDRAADWGEAASAKSSRAAHTVQDAADDLAEVVKERAGHSLDIFESLFNTIKSITAAVIVQKVTNWLRRAG